MAPAGAGRTRRQAMIRVSIAFALTLALFAVPALAAVNRGPYLQIGTPTSVVVKWRTDTASNSRVTYGTQPSSLTGTASSSTSTTNHEVTLTGLQPATRYYYAVGDSATIQASGS
ncbi:MAG TPA: fibronectin type III domain-containing protein, partial [Candidatus Polarisedimenticolia bacterium]|nr:fibronectin type III domain-containing protein [Candidatus Polarisedimenticolia bacterium]